MTESTELAVPNASDFANVGMEDVEASDMVMPTIKIVHKEAVFQDMLSNEKFDTLNCIILGLVKQRVLWGTTVDDDEPPLCRSYDHMTGYPDQKDASRFPWSASGFDQSDFPEGGLSCAACPLKEWGSHPNGKTPWCNEQHTYAIMLPGPDGDFVAPAVITFQKTGLKPSKQYLSSFARAKTPMFVAETNVTLTAMTRGQTDYAVPTFTRGAATPQESYQEYADSYLSIREYLVTPRTFDDGDEATPATETTATEATNTAPAATVTDDEMDF